uniref:Uncharacterized protein n=1 Tax=Oryza rufipogon TaxID=4529 RepID=A0A0E0R598_ORYRU
MPIKNNIRTTKSTAGETLSILSKSEAISVLIFTEHNSIVDHLTGMLNAMYNIRYRIISARILENLCTHCKERVNQPLLLQKVLSEILTTKTKPEAQVSDQERTISVSEEHEGRKHGISLLGDDEEMQCPKHNDKMAHDNASVERVNEDESEMKKMQEALLSLTLVLLGEFNGAERSAPMIPGNGPDGAFLERLKDIVDNYCQCQLTPISISIVKLCGQIAKSVMRGNRCTNDQKKEFVESLSKASETMANLETCVLFTGNDCGMERIGRPLLSDLEEELKDLVA